ncbi:hypothetical protein DXA13_10810 [Clostridium sp. AM58-1XD]|nr:hypothetical protein DXA13_10810 [Clostridium sp. AM58-1XD]
MWSAGAALLSPPINTGAPLYSILPVPPCPTTYLFSCKLRRLL